MRVDLSELPALSTMPTLPEGHRLVRFEQKYDELTRRARNDIFADHWGSTATFAEAWRHRTTGAEYFQPDLSFLLLSPERDEVAGFVLSAFFAADAAATGVRELYISHVGTRRSLRRRGLAAVLLGHVLTEAKARGFQRSAINVDVDNANRALGIYERWGYRITQHWSRYVREMG